MPAENNYHTFSQSSFLSPQASNHPASLFFIPYLRLLPSGKQIRDSFSCLLLLQTSASHCFDFLRIWQNKPGGNTFTQYKVFKVDLCGSMTKYFSPCCGWIVFHCMEILHFVYPFFGYLQILLPMYKCLCGALFNLFL